jgi:hypothetical protein
MKSLGLSHTRPQRLCDGTTNSNKV